MIVVCYVDVVGVNVKVVVDVVIFAVVVRVAVGVFVAVGSVPVLLWRE